jgi:hypothetical protein
VDGQKAPVPLLKDLFGSERRKAKVLNFSIAYGKTAHGLSRDWGTSLDEAKDTVERWYSDRPEVRPSVFPDFSCDPLRCGSRSSLMVHSPGPPGPEDGGGTF